MAKRDLWRNAEDGCKDKQDDGFICFHGPNYRVDGLRIAAMGWLEIIKVQGAKTGYQDADIELLKQLGQGPASAGLESARVYAHASVSNDLVITLKWDTDSPMASGSTLALSLAREFKRYGLVDHSVWIERLPQGL